LTSLSLFSGYFGVSRGVNLGKHLPYTVSPFWVSESCEDCGPLFARTSEGALYHIAGGGLRPAMRPLGTSVRRFLVRDVFCLVLEKFGGPVLLGERIRNQGLPMLDPAKPDETIPDRIDNE
jgi:hypothetical protein